MTCSRPRPPQSERQRLRTVAFERQNGLCHWCQTPMLNAKGKGPRPRPRALPFHYATLEHLVPRHIGGGDTEENTVAACFQCNQERGGAMTPPHSARYAPKRGSAR